MYICTPSYHFIYSSVTSLCPRVLLFKELFCCVSVSHPCPVSMLLSIPLILWANKNKGKVEMRWERFLVVSWTVWWGTRGSKVINHDCHSPDSSGRSTFNDIRLEAMLTYQTRISAKSFYGSVSFAFILKKWWQFLLKCYCWRC